MAKISRKAPPISPTKGYLLLEPIDQEQPGGFDVSGVEETPQRAKVLAVGPATWHEGGHKVFEAPAKRGDIVVHSAAGHESIRYKGVKYLLCPFGRILGVLEK